MNAVAKLSTRDAPFLHLRPRSRPPSRHICGWMQIIINYWKLCPGKKPSEVQGPERKKEKAQDEARASFSCTFISCETFDVKLSVIISPSASALIFSLSFHVLVAMVQINHGFVTSNNNLQINIEIFFFCGYKNRPKRTIAFKMTYKTLYKTMRQ